MNRANVVLTGLPRSGTTLTCYLLNKLPNTVALREPVSPGKLAHLEGEDAIREGLEGFFKRMRRMALTEGKVISKHVGGEVPDNSFGWPDEKGERRSVLEKGKIPVDKPLGADFSLVIKQPGLFTALLPALTKRLPCYAIIRNPLSILASHTSLGRLPGRHPDDRLSAAQMYDENLKRAMVSVPRGTLEWRLRMMSWQFERFESELPESHIIRYEDMVASGGRALSVVVPSAKELDEPLESKNMNELYDREKMRELGERLLESEGPYWRFYPKGSVEEMLAHIA